MVDRCVVSGTEEKRGKSEEREGGRGKNEIDQIQSRNCVLSHRTWRAIFSKALLTTR